MVNLKQQNKPGMGLRGRLSKLFLPRVSGKINTLEFSCFGITDDCILKCKMCHKWKEDIFIKTNQTVPTLQDWKNCICSLKRIASDNFQINFGGGEPFLKKDIIELIAFCRAKGFKTNVATNGYLIDPGMAKEIAACGLNSIIISLDSLNAGTHDYLRGVTGVYGRVMESITNLESSRDALYKGICCAIYDKNLDDILALAEWVDKDKRLNSIYFMAAMQPNNTQLDSTWYAQGDFNFLWPKDIQKVCAVIDRLIELKKNGAKITNQINQLEAFKLYYQHPERFVKNTKCNMDSALHISSCGDIFLCYRWAVLGNIKTDDLVKAWHSEIATGARADIATCKSNCHFLLNCFFKDDYPFGLS